MSNGTDNVREMPTPFPWFGGKSRAASIIWARLGDVRTSIAADVRAWAVENGTNPDLRIALCGYEGQHEMPGDWTVEEWKAAGGYSSTAAEETQGQLNRHRERVWFSPACVAVEQGVLFGSAVTA